MEIHVAHLFSSPTAGNVCRSERERPYIMTNVPAPPELMDPRNLILSVAPPAYNISMGLPFTAPIVSQSTSARVSYGPTGPLTGYSMANNPARVRSSFTHGLMNRFGNTNQSIVVSESIHILENLNFLGKISNFNLRRFHLAFCYFCFSLLLMCQTYL